MNRPDLPTVPAASPDDDPTGVRALLSGLPEPDPMPEDLVGRINASLAAEQDQRAARASGSPATSLFARARRRPGRLLSAIAGAAAAVAMVAAISSNLFTPNQVATTLGSAAIGSSSDTSSTDSSSSYDKEVSGGAPPSAADLRQDDKRAAGSPASPSLVTIQVSETRYTRVGFVTQAQTLRAAKIDQVKPMAGQASGIGPAGTIPGLTECLSTVGGAGAQVVRADVAFYEGRPAVIIIATENGTEKAYAVGRRCSPKDAAVLHPATPLP